MLFKSNLKKIIILGINHLSLNFASKMSKKNDIVMLDKEIRCDTNEVDVIIDKIGSDLIDKLNEYNLKKTNIFVSMTENEEYNLFSAELASKFGVEKTAAMVYSNSYNNLSTVDLIFNPYQLIVDKVNSLVKETRFNNIKNLIPGKVNISEIIITKKDMFFNKKLKRIKITDGLIVALKRNGKLTIPNAEMILNADDIIYFLYKKGTFSFIIKQIFAGRKVNKKVFIIGGRELGFIQAERWKNIFEHIIIIESDLKTCHKIAKKSNEVLILNGEGIEKKLLLEEGLTKESIFLSFDSNDFHNILSSYLAKDMRCNNIITLLNDYKYKDIADLLKLDNLIFVPEIVTNYLQMHLRKEYKYDKFFLGGEIYTAQIKINNNNKIINKKISELKNTGGILIGVISREDEIIIPDGNIILKNHDQLTIFYNKNSEDQLYNIFN